MAVLKDANKFRTWESCGKFHIQVPDPIFGKSNNGGLEAKLFGLGKADFFRMIREKYGAKLTAYSTFIGYSFETQAKANKFKNELNARLRKAI